MMTVIVFSAQLLPISETFILEQVRALRRWHPVLVGRQLAPNGLVLDGVDVQLLHPPGRIHRWSFRLCQALSLPYPPSLRRLRKIGASLVHVHFGTNAVDIWPLVRSLQLPMLVTLHGYDINVYREWWEAGHGGWHRRSYPHQLLRLAREPNVHFIAVSKYIRKRAIDFGIPADKVTICQIGVDIKKFQPAGLAITERARRILFVGRLIEKKGANYLIRAFSQVHRRIPNAELIIIGDGPLRIELENLAEELQVKVQFLGARDNVEVRRQMRHAHVFCLPSVTAANGDAEGLPMAILEAQACGIPVVTSAKGGATEGIRDGITGFLVDGSDDSALADKLKIILKSNNTLTRMSTGATAFISSHFDLEKLTASLEVNYDRWTPAIRAMIKADK